MKIKNVVDLLKAEVICGENQLDGSVECAFASDLMSDVLTLETTQVLLITGLCNLQTIRTAEMADISCILFVRGKKVTEEMKAIAEENEMVLIECTYSMFRTVGMLYSEGLNPVY